MKCRFRMIRFEMQIDSYGAGFFVKYGLTGFLVTIERE